MDCVEQIPMTVVNAMLGLRQRAPRWGEQRAKRSAEDHVQDLLRPGNRDRMLQFFNRITQDERLFAMGFCPATRGEAVATPTLATMIRCDNLDAFSGDRCYKGAAKVRATVTGCVVS